MTCPAPAPRPPDRAACLRPPAPACIQPAAAIPAMWFRSTAAAVRRRRRWRVRGCRELDGMADGHRGSVRQWLWQNRPVGSTGRTPTYPPHVHEALACSSQGPQHRVQLGTAPAVLGVPADGVAIGSQSGGPTASSDPTTGPLSCGDGGAPRGIRTPNRQIRSLVLCVDLVGSRPIWPAHVGGVVGPDGSRRIVWMINRMINARGPSPRSLIAAHGEPRPPLPFGRGPWTDSGTWHTLDGVVSLSR
jgi:hypothetical protein